MSIYVLGFDIGGTGVRGTLARLTTGVSPQAATFPAAPRPGDAAPRPGDAAPRPGDAGRRLATAESAQPVQMGPNGIDAQKAATAVVDLMRTLLPQGVQPAAIAIGCTGATLLGDGLRLELGSISDGPVVLCSDTLTSHLGALGTGGGAVIAAGTGAVALGYDGQATWRRADGWGTQLGDTGGGAWIGRHGIDLALRAQDGRPGGSTALLAALNARYGSAAELVAAVTGRPDRAAVLAAFAPDVAAAAASEPSACHIMQKAGRHLADTLIAALPEGAPPIAAATGNLFKAGPPLTTAFTDRLAERAPQLRLITPVGTSIDGAVALAAAVIHGALPPGAAVEFLAGTTSGITSSETD